MIFDPLTDFRDLSASIGTIALALLVWRTIGLWPLMTVALRISSILLALLVFICALGTARAASLGAPFNELQYALVAHYFLTITTSIFGPRLVGFLTRDQRDVTPN